MKSPYRIWRNASMVGGKRREYWSFTDPFTGRRLKRSTAARAAAELKALWRQKTEGWIKAAGSYRGMLEAIYRAQKAGGWSGTESLALIEELLPRVVAFGGPLKALPVLVAALEGGAAASTPCTVAEAVKGFMLTSTQRGLRERTLSDLRSRLGRFARDFPGPISAVRAEGVQRWFLKLRVAPRTRNNYLAAVQALFNSPALEELPAARRIRKLQPLDAEPPRKDIWTPAELLALLTEAQRRDAGVIPIFVLGAFAGLRTSEALRLHAPDLRLSRRDLIVERTKTKVKRARTVPVEGNLLEWLRMFAPRSGPLWEWHENSFHRRVRKLCAQTGLRWKWNGLRKSWSTYHDEREHNTSAQSRAAGNSPAMLERHYLAPRAAAEGAALEWFSIWPGDGIQGILPFPASPKPSPMAAPAANLL